MFIKTKRTRTQSIFITLILTITMIFSNIFVKNDFAIADTVSVTKQYQSEADRLAVEITEGTDPKYLAEASGGELVRTGPLNYCILEFKSSVSQPVKEEIISNVISLQGVISAQWSKKFKLETLSQKDESKFLGSAFLTNAVAVAITDPEYNLQWALKRIRAHQVWEEGITGQGVIIAVIDTGVDLDHPDLVDAGQNKNNLVQGYNAFTRSSLPGSDQDDNGHGTSVAGVIAALNNNKGIVGIAYDAKIMPIKAMDANGEGEDSIIADGIIWAADHGAKIINMSIGSEEQTGVLDDAIQYAVDKGCLLIGASGNKKGLLTQSYPSRESDTTDKVSFPAASPNVIAVSAVDMDDNITDFSLTGPEILLSAPGKKILTDYWSQTEEGCAYSTGTSIAAPFVTASAALLWSKYPQLKASDIKKALISSSYDIGEKGRDYQYGYGRVDAYRALKVLENQKAYPVSAYLGWEGGRVFAGSSSEAAEASLRIQFGTFPLQVLSDGEEAKLNVSLNPVNPPGDFPENITPAGYNTYSVNWGEHLAEKVLYLKLKLTPVPITGQERKIAYLYKWSNYRWIRVGGGYSDTSQEIEVTIYEPGIYRAGWSPEPNTNRIAGNDRILTAIEIARQTFPTGTDNVIIARADDFPDALAGAPLAYKLHAPILLTYNKNLPDEVYQTVKDLHPSKIFILGGEGAVSSLVQDKLSQIAYVNRLAGDNRYSTATAIAELLGTRGKAVIVNSHNYPDAIAAASHAAFQGLPILLTPAHSLNIDTEAELNRCSITETDVIGGQAVISDEVLAKLSNAVRISGANRYDTSAEVIKKNTAEGRVLFIASGNNFPDALTGGVLAAANYSNILLLPEKGPTTGQADCLGLLTDKKIIALGGAKVISDEVLQKVQTLIKQ